MKPIFFYGSLREHALLEIVVGHPVAVDRFVDARADGFVTCRLDGEAYPLLLPKSGAWAEGKLYLSPSDEDVARLQFFEEAEYDLVDLPVEVAGIASTALYFRATDKRPATGLLWDYADWEANDRRAAIHAAREYMAYFGKLSIEEVDRIWPSVMTRADQRARAETETRAVHVLGRGFGPSDVEISATHIAHAGYMTVEDIQLKHRRFDGSWTPTLDRVVAVWGDAATLLPYDAVRDRVMLIEQFRPGPAMRRDPSPWCIEVIAGRIDPDETPEAAARREAVEEGGVSIAAIEALPPYYPTPGLAAEKFYGFIGQADLPGEGGLHGLAAEGEDIRTLILPFDQAMAALSAGEVNTSIAQVSLLWLGANRERLRAAWSQSS